MDSYLKSNRPTPQVVSKIPFFKEMGIEFIELLSERMLLSKAAKNDMIVFEGDKTKTMYFILDGTVNVFRKNFKGKKENICELTAPNYFGEMSIIDGGPRSASIEAKTDVLLVELKWDDVRCLFEDKPEIMCYIFKNIGSTLSMRLRRVNSLYSNLATI